MSILKKEETTLIPSKFSGDLRKLGLNLYEIYTNTFDNIDKLVYNKPFFLTHKQFNIINEQEYDEFINDYEAQIQHNTEILLEEALVYVRNKLLDGNLSYLYDFTIWEGRINRMRQRDKEYVIGTIKEWWELAKKNDSLLSNKDRKTSVNLTIQHKLTDNTIREDVKQKYLTDYIKLNNLDSVKQEEQQEEIIVLFDDTDNRQPQINPEQIQKLLEGKRDI